MTAKNFDNLTPDILIAEVEAALATPMTGLAAPLPSYINRVYELETADHRRVIAKFYRPGRWNRQAVEEEHRFVLDCAADDIPVIAPLELPHGGTLAQTEDGILFTVFPKRFGREIEITDDESWKRLGMIVARMHLAGARAEAPDRTLLDPRATTANQLEHLLKGKFITAMYEQPFERVVRELLEEIDPLFDDIEYIRIHADLHRANILERPGEGLMIIDFDDMMEGPPVQDLWLLLPEHVHKCRRELDLLLDGYCSLRDFEFETVRLIEPLRAMRIIYFLDWCSTQIDDFRFQHNFPDWGSDAFWRRETADLQHQLELIREYSSN
ncbi:serine/threonine protein kinase [Lentisphaerota bacterium ZTH]|nr:serine/threonine protein kinase [Lentisphaerota bacterium]WET07221.1 serine/threonine protein kinase [Lentisphaerota bacterium ZTH]